MTIRKRLTSIVLAGALGLGTAGCSVENSPTASKSTPTQENQENLRVGGSPLEYTLPPGQTHPFTSLYRDYDCPDIGYTSQVQERLNHLNSITDEFKFMPLLDDKDNMTYIRILVITPNGAGRDELKGRGLSLDQRLNQRLDWASTGEGETPKTVY